MRALVTGGAGFIGSNLALELEAKGHDVVVLDDFSTGRFENLRGFAGDLVAADVAKAADWIYRVGPVDAVFHQAAITDTTVTDQRRMLEVNVEGFRNVLDFASETGAQRVVYASSAGVYGAGPTPMKESQKPEPLNVYGFSKRVMERVASDFQRDNPGLRVIGLRYFNVYGPRESFKKAAASMIWQLSGQIIAGKRPRVFKWGEQFRDFIYVKDVVAANLRGLEAEAGGVFNVCTGKPATFNKIIETLHAVLGTRLETEYFENPYSFYQNETLGDPSGASSVLGFTARYSIEEGIRDYLSGFKPSGHDKTVTLKPEQIREALKAAHQ
ncbi:MAG: ADP-glyceromanno-heptose 6-epimerase [Elusimicrobia bacterium]|nr:ADP-glyceromanno-heptose 6-epimerase [Elusimicrobiota bacterium]